MSMIQDESGRPAPKLKNYIWTSEEEKKEIFGQVKEVNSLPYFGILTII
jgi:serine/threonine-protein kinase RIO1